MEQTINFHVRIDLTGGFASRTFPLLPGFAGPLCGVPAECTHSPCVAVLVHTGAAAHTSTRPSVENAPNAYGRSDNPAAECSDNPQRGAAASENSAAGLVQRHRLKSALFPPAQVFFFFRILWLIMHAKVCTWCRAPRVARADARYW